MIKLIKEVKLFNAGYVQLWDFSEANANEENRIEAITTVANVCRGDKGVKNPKELYQQLLTEHDGKPGSVFEFVPFMMYPDWDDFNIHKYGIHISEGEFASNLRAGIADGYINRYNKVINGFFVFKVKIPQMIVKHILRHRMLSFQEMSERTNKLREYYYCDELEPIIAKEFNWFNAINPDGIVYTKDDYAKHWDKLCHKLSQRDFDILQNQYKIRQELLNKGSHGLAYTTLWIAGWKQDSLGWDNFFAVRTKKPAQREVIELANVIKDMMEG